MGHVRVTKFHYKLGGFCQSSIVESSDGSLYVLKMSGAHMHNLLFNEAFGTELLRYFGLPVADWIPLQVEDEFIQLHPKMWLKTGHHGRRPISGLHFGSRLVSPRRGAGAFQIIPSSWVPRVKNRNQFIGALAIDIWTNHCDRRQAIFTRSGENLKATFIDNGHMFGGLTGDQITSPRRCMNFDLSIYRGLEIGQVLECWRRRIMAVDLTKIHGLSNTLPSEWRTREVVASTMASLEARRQKLEVLFREAEVIIHDHDSLESKEFVNSLAPRVMMTPE